VRVPSSSESSGSRTRTRCDVLIVGAGPAGSAAARVLSTAGLRVILAEQRPFPRDKVCGDGLISDAIGALATLGLHDRVFREAVCATELRVYAPGGQYAPITGSFACVPRHTLDPILCDAACDAGALFRPGMTAVAGIDVRGRVAGARFTGPEGAVDVHADLTLLATGANASALAAFGLRVPMQPDAVAGRAYFEAPRAVADDFRELIIAYDRDWCPGYGWIFPSPGQRFNIGVGLFAGAAGGGRLHAFWEHFTTRFAPAAAIVGASRQVSRFRGAPLRAGLAAAQFGRPGLLAIGEAAAVTYSATGEGIGKAMESGMLAAAFVMDALSGRRSVAALHQEYELEFRRRFASRYRAYAVAQSWASHPFVLDLLATRAGRGRFAREQLEALVDERGDPRSLFSVSGLLRALVQ
jgi:geranylgeranyl reductase family protein